MKWNDSTSAKWANPTTFPEPPEATTVKLQFEQSLHEVTVWYQFARSQFEMIYMKISQLVVFGRVFQLVLIFNWF